MNSKKRLDAVLVEKFGMIVPQKQVIYKDVNWVKKKDSLYDIDETERYAYIIPFWDNLKALINNDEVRFHIENPKQHVNDVYRTVLDGSFYRNNEFFAKNPNALAIILYYDDLGVANPLGVNSKAQKLSMFYWSLANIDPQVRSTESSIQLLAIVKTEWLKKKGALRRVLEPFVQDILKLQTEGMAITVKGHEKIFKGSLLFCAGDTPASALIGGFKESVSVYRFCRQCLTTKYEWKNNFSEQYFTIRDKICHTEHVVAVTEPNVSTGVTEYWKKQYGVNCESPLSDIPIFDATMCLPQDAMHVLIEGVAEIACKNLLRYFIIEKKIFTLEQFNEWRCHFRYYGHFKKDAPAVILHEHLSPDGKLRQTAAQMFVLVHIIPFLIAESTILREEQDIRDRLLLHAQLLRILNMCLAYKICSKSIDLLSRMIELYITRFDNLYPNTIVPKFHFLVHVPRCIRLFGPARQQWCFRFESVRMRTLKDWY